MNETKQNVFSNIRIKNINTNTSIFLDNSGININCKNIIDGIELMNKINDNQITACFFDPQYRGIMDKMNYGNEGKRQKERFLLTQMTETIILKFIKEIDRTLIKTGHLFLWVDKFHLCEGTKDWFSKTSLSIVDLIIWDKGKIGMGYRTRRRSEYLIILQKKPNRAKGIWCKHNIPDVWLEKITKKEHPHQKPLQLQKNLIEAISGEGDYILDPCAGSYSVLEACKLINRNFIGCDIQNEI